MNGRPVEECYEGPLYELDDGTYDAASMSVVCNPCYVHLMPLTPSGQALMNELDAAIEMAHGIDHDLCARCQKREGTEMFVGDGGALAMVHGFHEMWCPRCIARLQLRHALSRAARIPKLAWRAIR